MHPTDGDITQEVFAENQASGQGFPHTGRDYGANRGDPVRTIADGTVIFAGSGPVPDWLANRFMLIPGSDSGGNYVFIQHEGWVEYFGHLDTLSVKTGQSVNRGGVVGGAGDSGGAQGVHLHYEVIKEPCGPVYPWGRYHPQLQIDHEDRAASVRTVGKITTKEWDEMASKAEIRAEIDAALDVKLAEFKSGITGKRNAGRTYLDIMAAIKEGSKAAIKAANNTETLTSGVPGVKHVGRVREILETLVKK